MMCDMPVTFLARTARLFVAREQVGAPAHGVHRHRVSDSGASRNPAKEHTALRMTPRELNQALQQEFLDGMGRPMT